MITLICSISASKKLNASNFNDKVLKSPENWFLKFHAPWCGHCKTLAPVWEQVATKLEGIISFGSIDCEDSRNKSLCQIHGVEGYPTLKFWKTLRNTGDKTTVPVSYNGERNVNALMNYALDNVTNYAEKIDDIDTFLSNDGDKVVLCTDKIVPTALFKALSANLRDSIKFGFIGGNSDVDNVCIKRPMLVFYAGGQTNEYSGKFNYNDINGWIKKLRIAFARDSNKSL